MKKFFSKLRIVPFLKQYGILTGTLVCAAATALAIGFSNNSIGSPGQIDNTPQPTINESDDVPSSVQNDEKLSDVESTAQPTVAQPTGTDDKEVAASNAASQIPTMQWPVKGDIQQAYAMDTLEYSTTLEQWMTHSGVDILANAGDQVVAVLDGTVESVTQDALYGNCVVIKHDNKFQTLYAALDKVSVKEGDTVKQGNEIGTVGNSAKCEVAQGNHLHFEALLNDEPVNPQPFFANK